MNSKTIWNIGCFAKFCKCNFFLWIKKLIRQKNISLDNLTLFKLTLYNTNPCHIDISVDGLAFWSKSNKNAIVSDHEICPSHSTNNFKSPNPWDVRWGIHRIEVLPGKNWEIGQLSRDR